MPRMTTAEYRYLLERRYARNGLRFTSTGVAPIERESDLHDQIEAWCRARGYYYVHSRMDRRTTTQIGVPDFLIFAQARVVCVEVKRPGSKQTPAQLAAQAQLRKLGHVCEVVYSFDQFLHVMNQPEMYEAEK